VNIPRQGAVFIATMLLMVVSVLHSPWTGYMTEQEGFYFGGAYIPGAGNVACTPRLDA